MADSILETTAVQIVVDDSRLDRELQNVRQRVRRYHREQTQSAQAAAQGTVQASRRQVQAQSSVASEIERGARMAMTLRREYENNVLTKKEFVRQANTLRESLVRQSSEVERGSKAYDRAQLGAQRLSTALATTRGETSKLGISANIATGAQEGIRRALDRTGPAGRAASQGLGLMQGAFRNLQQPLDLSNMGLNRFMGLARAMPAIMATASIAIAGLAVAGMSRLANQAAQAADEVDKGAAAAGLAVEAYQELRFAFTQGGVAAEQFDRGMTRLNQSIGEAASGSGRASDAFRSMGVSVRDTNGNLRDTEEILNDTIASLSSMGTVAEQTAAATDVFGRTGRDLIPVLRDGTEGINGLREQARELGLVMSGSSVMSLVEYKDQVATLQQQFQTARVEIAASFLPILRELVSLVQAQVVPRIQDLATGVSDFVERLGGVDEASAAFRREMAANLAAVARFGGALGGIANFALAAGQSVIGFAAGVGGALGQLSFELENNFLRTVGGLLPDPGRAGDEFARSQLTPEQQEGLPTTPERPGERIAEAARVAAGDSFASAQASLERSANAFSQAVNTELQGNIEEWLAGFFVNPEGASTIAGLSAGGTAGADGTGGAGTEPAPAGSLRALLEEQRQVREEFDNATTRSARRASMERLEILEDEIAEMRRLVTPEALPQPDVSAEVRRLPGVAVARDRTALRSQLDAQRDALFGRTVRPGFDGPVDVDAMIAGRDPQIRAERAARDMVIGIADAAEAEARQQERDRIAGFERAGAFAEGRLRREQDPNVQARMAAQQGGVLPDPEAEQAWLDRMESERELVEATAQAQRAVESLTDTYQRQARIAADPALQQRLAAQQGGGLQFQPESRPEIEPFVDRLTPGERRQRADVSTVFSPTGGTSLDFINDWRRIQDEAAEAQRQAGFQFAQQVVGAGDQLVNAFQSFQEGNVGAGIQGLGQTASSVLGAVGGLVGSSTLGPIGALIGAGTSIIGGLVGRTGGDATEPSRAAGAATRGAPSISMSVTVNQDLSVQSLTDPQSRAAINSLLDETVSRLDDVVTRSLAPRLNRVEERVDALAGT